jgi:hypothetical protein
MSRLMVRTLSEETVPISDRHWQQLVDASRLTGDSPAEIARQAIDAYLANQRRVLECDGLTA